MTFSSTVIGLSPYAFYRCQDALPSTSFATTVLGLSPYFFYRCQDSSGTNVVDSSGNSRTGTIAGTVTLNQQGLVFDGRDARSILVGTNPTRGDISAAVVAGSPGIANSAFTIGFAWTPTQTAISYLCGAGNSTTTGLVGWLLTLDGANLAISINQAGYNAGTTNATVSYATAGIVVGVEQFYWLTYDGAGNWALYINGGSSAVMTVSLQVLLVPTTPTMIFGGYNVQVQSSGGYFAEIMSFPSVLSLGNRQAIYNAAIQTGLSDSSGNGRNGQVLGALSFGQPGLVFDGNTAGSILDVTNPVPGGMLVPTTSPGAANAAFTIGFFWKPTQTGISYLCGSGDNVSNSGWNLAIDGTYLYLCVNLNGFSNTLYKARATYAAAGIAAGVSQLYFLTYDGTANWNLYINGNSTPLFTVGSTAMVTPTSKKLEFGGYDSLPFTSGGQISEIMIFSTVISTANMLAIYNAGTQFAPLGAPVISVTNGAGPVISWTNPTGGTAPYSYQLYRKTSSFAYPDAGSSLVYSGTANTFTDSAPPTVLEFYVVNASDSSSPAKTGASFVVAGMDAPSILVGMIGDSRTQGYNPQGNTNTAALLNAPLQSMLSGYVILTNNQGIGGTTTLDWSTGSSDLANAVASFKSQASGLIAGSKVFIQIMLGINDAKISVRTSLTQYATNIRYMINYIQSQNIPFFSGIVLHQSFQMNVGAIGITDFDYISNLFVGNYNLVLGSFVDGKTVFQGDTKSPVFFALNPGLLTDGLHPYTGGYTYLSYEHAAAYAKILGATGTKYPPGPPIGDLNNGAIVTQVPWGIPASGVPGASGTAQLGSTTFSTPSGAGTELCNLLDRMVSDGRATIS